MYILPRCSPYYVYHSEWEGFAVIEPDTVKFLRECDAGVKMGVKSIEDVMEHVHAQELRDCLSSCKKAHQTLAADIEAALDRFHDDGKEPDPIAKGMSWMKTNLKLVMDESDEMIADLMTDGCNMGVKSLSRYLNQYAAADEAAKDITKRLIRLEERLSVDMRGFL